MEALLTGRMSIPPFCSACVSFPLTSHCLHSLFSVISRCRTGVPANRVRAWLGLEGRRVGKSLWAFLGHRRRYCMGCLIHITAIAVPLQSVTTELSMGTSR